MSLSSLIFLIVIPILLNITINTDCKNTSSFTLYLMLTSLVIGILFL